MAVAVRRKGGNHLKLQDYEMHKAASSVLLERTEEAGSVFKCLQCKSNSIMPVKLL